MMKNLFFTNPINVPIVNNSGKSKALWMNVDGRDDWLVSCYFLKQGGNSSTDKIAIPKSKCTPKQGVGRGIGYFDNVDIDLSTLPNQNGKIVLNVNWVGSMSGGFSIAQNNMIAIATKTFWNIKTIPKQNEVMVHEMGHQLGMTPGGSKNPSLLDETPNFYENKGHQGPHCHSGIPNGQLMYNSSVDRNASNCVMYGATNGLSDFCTDCEKAVKKVDLLNGV